MTQFLKLFRNIALATLVFCAAPMHAISFNAVTLNKALSAPVQKMWPNAVAFVAAGVVGNLASSTIAYQSFEPKPDIARGVLFSSITLALLKGAHYCPGGIVPKLVAVAAMPIFAASLGGAKMCLTSCASSIAAVAAANYVQ